MGQQTEVTYGQHTSEAEAHSLRFFPTTQDAFPLLMTRVHVPPLPVDVVARPRLTSLLDKRYSPAKAHPAAGTCGLW